MADRVNIYEQGARLAVFALTEWESKDKGRSGTRFDRVGSAWVNRDGSLNLYLDLLPAQGQKLQIRTQQQRGEPDAQAKGPDGADDESPDRPF